MDGARIQQENQSTMDAEERDRWKQYLVEFVDSENNAGNATTLEGRAELAHRCMDDNRGSANATRESFDAARRGATGGNIIWKVC